MKNKAFTLIELLVVIAIISLLSSVVLVSVNTSRIKSRDAKRLEDLIQMRTALTMYLLDNGGIPSCVSNPCSGTSISSVLSPTLTLTSKPNDRWWNTVVFVKKAEAGSTYISKIPSDPMNTSGIIYYYSTGPIVQYGYVDKNGKTTNLSRQGVFFMVSESKTQNISNPHTIGVTIGERHPVYGYGANIKEILGGSSSGDSGSGSYSY